MYRIILKKIRSCFDPSMLAMTGDDVIWKIVSGGQSGLDFKDEAGAKGCLAMDGSSPYGISSWKLDRWATENVLDGTCWTRMA